MNNFNILAYLQQRYGSADWSKWTAHRWQFYDYIRYTPAGVTQLSFFAVALGGVDPVSSLSKTREQTNMPKTRSFGAVQFLIKDIRTHIKILAKNRQATATAADTNLLVTSISNMVPKYVEMYRRGVLNITFGEKEYFSIPQPFRFAGAGFGIQTQQHASTFTDSDDWKEASLWGQQCPNGKPFSLSPPQLVEPEQTISATIDYPTTSPVFTGLVDSEDPRIDVGLILDGYIIRPAQ